MGTARRRPVGRRPSRWPGHQTVAAYLALALIAVTGAAYAAATVDSGDVINNSLTSADLKNNAGVRGPDIPPESLRSADFGRGSRASIAGPDVADNSLGGTPVNEAALLASRVVARLGGPVNQPIATAMGPVPLTNNTYTQNAGRPNQYIGGGQMTFSPTCTQPRSATVLLLLDDPALTGPAQNVIGAALINDSGAGAATKTFSFTGITGAGPSMNAPAMAAATPRGLFLQADLNCSAGSGATLDRVTVDTVEHR